MPSTMELVCKSQREQSPGLLSISSEAQPGNVLSEPDVGPVLQQQDCKGKDWKNEKEDISSLNTQSQSTHGTLPARAQWVPGSGAFTAGTCG